MRVAGLVGGAKHGLGDELGGTSDTGKKLVSRQGAIVSIGHVSASKVADTPRAVTPQPWRGVTGTSPLGSGGLGVRGASRAPSRAPPSVACTALLWPIAAGDVLEVVNLMSQNPAKSTSQSRTLLPHRCIYSTRCQTAR